MSQGSRSGRGTLAGLEPTGPAELFIRDWRADELRPWSTVHGSGIAVNAVVGVLRGVECRERGITSGGIRNARNAEDAANAGNAEVTPAPAASGSASWGS